MGAKRVHSYAIGIEALGVTYDFPNSRVHLIHISRVAIIATYNGSMFVIPKSGRNPKPPRRCQTSGS